MALPCVNVFYSRAGGSLIKCLLPSSNWRLGSLGYKRSRIKRGNLARGNFFIAISSFCRFHSRSLSHERARIFGQLGKVNAAVYR